MQNLTKVFSVLLILLTGVQLMAQTGTIRGTVYDEATGETILFANVLITGTTDGTSTDLDGTYALELAAGTYSLTVSYLGYSNLIQDNIQVKPGEVTLLDLKLLEESEMIDEVVIKAKQVRNTETSLMTIQRKSANLLDGVSAQSFRKIGDSNAGEALKRVTGVSIEGGKHVYVRGLGDRYSKTILNGMDMPGLDPDRNSVEMDIFPTNIIDNILVYKSFSPDLPGDFSGGVVDVVTKDFPEEKFTNVGFSLNYNMSQHFKANALSYEGGNMDWLGIDDGTRALPISRQEAIPDESLDSPQLTDMTQSFNPTMSAQETGNNLNKSLSFSTGNQIETEKATLGYIFAANWKENFNHFDNIENNIFLIPIEPGETDLLSEQMTSGTVSSRNNFSSAMAGLSAKRKNHRLSMKYLVLQNGLSTAALLTQRNLESNPSTIIKNNLEYNQRTVNSILVDGKHVFGNTGNFEVAWKYAPTFINVQDPDIRSTGFEQTEIGLEWRPSVGASINRVWRDLTEQSHNAKADVTYKFNQWSGLESKLKAGGGMIMKHRDFSITNFFFSIKNQFNFDINGNPDQLFSEENIWTPESGKGVYVTQISPSGSFEPANVYESNFNIMSAYVLNELPITKNFKAIYGLRVEKSDIRYTGQNNQGTRKYTREKVLDDIDFLPSVNLVYSVNDKMNVRASANRTVARPTFKEKSIAQIQDRISGRAYYGNIDLESTDITNMDLRWEYFFAPGQLFSVSSFYKHFDKPIELVPYASFEPASITPRNQDQGRMIGTEVEFRTKLGFVSPVLKNLGANANFTYVKSSVDVLDENGNAAGTRDAFLGLSPFSVNAGLSYNIPETGLQTSIAYNLQGKRLTIAGAGSIPDVYDNPFHSLKVKLIKTFGQNTLSIMADNLLNQDNIRWYEWEGASPEVFQQFHPGMNIGFSFGRTF